MSKQHSVQSFAVSFSDDHANQFPTLGWLRDGRVVVQATARELERHPQVMSYGECEECEATDPDALEVIGADETNFIRTL